MSSSPTWDAVTVELRGEVRPIIHDERDAARLRDRLQHRGRPAHRGIVDLLEPQLQAGDIAARERLFEVLREPVGIQRRRRNEIEPGGRRSFSPFGVITHPSPEIDLR